jgi:chromosome segregation ATPase
MQSEEMKSRITRLEHSINALRLEIASNDSKYRDIATQHNRLTKIVSDFAPAVKALQDQITHLYETVGNDDNSNTH